MTLLQVRDLKKEYDHRLIWGGVSFHLAAGERVGLIGPNGAGKTALLRILAGRDEATSGEVSWVSPGLRLGYLEQKPAAPAGGEVRALHAVLDSDPVIGELGRQLRAAEPAPAAFYYGLLDAYQAAGGYEREAEAATALRKMGLSEAEIDLPVEDLSGGQRTRVGLAAALLAAPDVLLLDEPTSHLDLEALEWLEETLRRYRGLVMVVSHDRYFLDAVATRILELADGELRGFAGDHSAYRREKDRLAAEQASVYRKQRREVEALESAVRRERQWFDSAARGPRRSGEPGGFAGKYRDRATKHSTRFQAKEKRLERIDAERVEKPRTAATIEPKFGRVAINPRFGRATINPRSGRKGGGQARFLLRTADLGMAYPGKPLFAGANLALERGTRVAIIGPNGCGKTTLLRILLGQEKPTAGRVERAGFSAGYFAQEAETLDPRRTVFQEVAMALEEGISELEEGARGEGGAAREKAAAEAAARSFAGAFLFRGEDVARTVAQLSSGERARLALAKLVARNPDVLILDEPTNHLDLPAREKVETALEAFPGAILLVSHDRYLLRKLANRVWAFAGRGGARIVSYTGGYDDYLIEIGRHALERRVPGSGDRKAHLAVLETRLAVVGARMAECRTGLDDEELTRLGDEFLRLQRQAGEIKRELGMG